MTGLRGAGALLVIIHHYINYSIPPTLAPRMLYHAYEVVDLFFVLSGFVLGATHGREFLDCSSVPRMFASLATREHGGRGWIDRHRRSTYYSFMVKRVARIYPLYAAITFVLVLAVLGGASDRIAIGALPTLFVTNILMVQSWFGIHSLEWPMWSVSAEWITYLGFPFLVLLVLGRLGTALATVAVCAVALTLAALLPGWTFHHPERLGALNHSFLAWGMMSRSIAGFVFGLFAFRLSTTAAGRAIAASRWLDLVLVVTATALLAWEPSDLLIIAIFPFLVISLSEDRGILAWLLSRPTIHRLGVWSYSIYLLHPLARRLCWRLDAMIEAHGVPHTPAILIAIVPTVLLVVLAARFSFEWIEKPGRRAIQRRGLLREQPAGRLVPT